MTNADVKTPGRRLACLTLGLLLACSLAACGGKPPISSWPPINAIVAAQIENLGSSDYTVRRCAATALGIIGPEAVLAVPALEKAAQEDHEPTVRAAALKALDLINSSVSERRCRSAVQS